MKYLVKVVFNINQENGIERLKEYTFAAFEEYESGDVVVVDTRNGYQLVTVIGVAEKLPDFIPNESLKEVVCKVDFSKFNERKERKAKAQKLKKQMDEKVKILQSNAIYEMLAEKDPELKQMLEQFKKLNS